MTEQETQYILTYLETINLQQDKVKATGVDYLQRQIKENKWPLKIEFDEKGNAYTVEVGESTEACLNRFITVNEKMLSIKNEIRKLASWEESEHQLFTVLIQGPTGTGKELLARALHGERTGKFIAVNCAGLPEHLVESLMFGHKQGAFTSAIKTVDGHMSQAKNGTLFLDEVGDLPLSSQGKFLRAIQSRTIIKVGGDKEEEINCRIVCATNKSLDSLLTKSLFRLDLFARLTTFSIETTDLHERREDVWPIIRSIKGGKEFEQAFLEKIKGTNKTQDDIDLSLNVRSLQQHIKRYIVLGKLPL